LKGKQYTIKVYETSVEDEDKFISFFEANYPLFKDHLIVIHGGLSQRVQSYLTAKPLTFVQNIDIPKARSQKEVELDLETQKSEQREHQKRIEHEFAKLTSRLENNLRVIDTMVRSGQELTIEGDLLLLNRVNSGATINISGNLIITHVIEGLIKGYGSFMMLSNSPKATILFHDREVDSRTLSSKLNKIEIVDDVIIVTPVLKGE